MRIWDLLPEILCSNLEKEIPLSPEKVHLSKIQDRTNLNHWSTICPSFGTIIPLKTLGIMMEGKMKTKIMFFGLVLILISCSSPEEPIRLNLQIQGMVTGQDNSPIEGASVLFYKAELRDGIWTSIDLDFYRTDEEGNFFLNGDVTGECNNLRLLVSFPNHHILTYPTDVDRPDIQCIEELQIINIQLDPL